MAVAYTFPDHIKGDTFEGQRFTININDSAANFSGASIKMDMRTSKTLPTYALRLSTDNGGISIIDPPESGIFEINSQIIDIPAKKYFYDIQITYADGEVKTYIAGEWTITQDVTYD